MTAPQDEFDSLEHLFNVAPPPDWEQALCAQVGPAFWDNDADAFTLEAEAAKRICGECPVQDECLNYALDNALDHGIWGGIAGAPRRIMRQSRQRNAA